MNFVKAIKLESVSDEDVSSQINQWYKRVGEYISKDEPLVEVESDKATYEIPSPFSGIVTKILVNEGESVVSGTEICLIDTSQNESREIVQDTQTVNYMDVLNGVQKLMNFRNVVARLMGLPENASDDRIYKAINQLKNK